jgi:hypothetical protein
MGGFVADHIGQGDMLEFDATKLTEHGVAEGFRGDAGAVGDEKSGAFG